MPTGNAQRRKGAKRDRLPSPSCSSGMAEAGEYRFNNAKKLRRTVSRRIKVNMRLQMIYVRLLRIVFVHGKGKYSELEKHFSRVLMKTLFALTTYSAALFLEFVPIYRSIWNINVFLKR